MLVDYPEIEPLDRLSFLVMNGLVSLMEPDTEELMRERARESLVDAYDSPHSRAWHVSMHASEMPGDQQSACERYFVYRMMNVPATEPTPPWVSTCGTVGKAGELDIVDAWFRGGRMLAIPEGVEREPWFIERCGHVVDVHQLGFEDRGVWMTASTDLPVLKKGWRKPYIVEVKSAADEKVEEMLTGRRKDGTYLQRLRGPDEQHRNQLLATLGLAGEYDWGSVSVCRRCWFVVWADVYERLGLPGGAHPLSDAFGCCPRCRDYDTETFALDPPDCGEIYYWSRSWPRKTKSFFYARDQAFIDRGRDVFARSREALLLGKLPERPEHFQWSLGACASCRFKPSCRLDFGLSTPRKRKPDMEPVTRLADSHAVEYAKSVRPGYDFDATRMSVIMEWI